MQADTLARFKAVGCDMYGRLLATTKRSYRKRANTEELGHGDRQLDKNSSGPLFEPCLKFY